MAFLQRLIRGSESRSFENPAVPLSAPEFWSFLTAGSESTAGELVNDTTAMQIASVYACVRVLAESVGSLPLRLLRKTEQGREAAFDHPLFRLLAVEPNPEMSALSFFESWMVGLCLAGNCYAQIEWDSNGQPVALWPLSPRQTMPYRLPNGVLAYRTSDGMDNGATRILQAADVLHVPLLSHDGIVGLSPIQQARNTLGLSRAAEKFQSRFLRSYATPSVALKTEKTIKPEDKAKMRGEWEALQSGSNQHRVAILDNSLDVHQLSISPEDAALIGTMGWTRSEIAAVYRVPPHMIGELQKLSNSNTENMNLSFVVDTLRPYLSRIEAEISRKLLPPNDGKGTTYEVLFDVSERLRGDFASSAAGYAAGRQWGWLSANDVRRDIGLNPGGPELDKYLTPVNMEDPSHLSKPAA